MPASTGSRCARAWATSARRSATEQIDEITRLYGDFTEGEQVKIFPNEAFGYQRITVERPLRLRWEVTAETMARLAETKQWAKLDRRRAGRPVGPPERPWTAPRPTEPDRLAKKLGSVPKAIEKAALGRPGGR